MVGQAELICSVRCAFLSLSVERQFSALTFLRNGLSAVASLAATQPLAAQMRAVVAVAVVVLVIIIMIIIMYYC